MFDNFAKKLALTAAGAMTSGALLMGASAIAYAEPDPEEPNPPCYGLAECPIKIPTGYGGYWAKDGVPAGGFANGKGGGGGIGGYWGKDGKPAGGFANGKGGGAASHGQAGGAFNHTDE